MNVHFLTESNEWETPVDLFNRLNEKYNFAVDLACTSLNKKCHHGLAVDEGFDSLTEIWELFRGNLWCNPPYGRNINKWARKAYFAAQYGAKIVMLIPARTDTSYWHDYIFKNKLARVEFIRGRLRFSGSKNSAPFPSALVYFNL